MMEYAFGMKIDAKEILDELAKGPGDRKRVSLYLSESVLSDFRKACGQVPPSQVMEKLMVLFSASAEAEKGKR